MRSYPAFCIIFSALIASLPLVATAQPVPPPSPVDAGTAPAVTLPAVSMPVVPSGAPVSPPVAPSGIVPAAAADNGAAQKPVSAGALPGVGAAAVPSGTPAASPPSPATNDGDEKFSYGDRKDSLFFTAEQVEQLKTVLRAYEIRLKNPQAAGSLTVIAKAAEMVVEPAAYPVFYVSSIAYRNPHDWTVWVQQNAGTVMAVPAPAGAASPVATQTPSSSSSPTGAANTIPASVPATDKTATSESPLIKLTPRNNTGELIVVSITPDHVVLHWKPTYLKAIDERIRRKLFAVTDTQKHRLASGAAVHYVPGDAEVMVTLKENQAFVAGYFACFEGRVANPVLPPLPVSQTPEAVSAGAVAPVSPEDAAAIAAGQAPQGDDIDSLLARSTAQQQAKIAAEASNTAAASQ